MSPSVAPTTATLPLELNCVLGKRNRGSGGKYDVVAEEEEEEEEEGDCDGEDKRNEESFNVNDDIFRVEVFETEEEVLAASCYSENSPIIDKRSCFSTLPNTEFNLLFKNK